MKPELKMNNFSSVSFEDIINEAMSLYESYTCSFQKQSNGDHLREIKGDTKSEIANFVDSCNYSDGLFEKFIAKFNFLLKKINELKRENYVQFINTFQTTNVFIAKLYEFVSKLLDCSITYIPEIDRITKSVNNQIVFVSRSIELLHVILSSNFFYEYLELIDFTLIEENFLRSK